MLVRLQKVIAGSGLASRRQAETLIRDGRVTVNGIVIHKLGTCVDPLADHIKVNGDRVGSAEPEVFILLHKPAGYVTTMKDPQGRPTVADLVDRVRLRVFPVGRLDYDAEGLLLLTNNGQIAQACLHPKYHVPKTYLVKVSKVLTEEELARLRQGIQLDDGMTSPAVVKKSGKARVNSWIEMTIYEGRAHQVKRMVEALGHRVLRLKRTRFGPLGLGDLLPGALRFATDAEANALRAILQRAPRREKLPSKIVRAPGGPIQRIGPQGRTRSAPQDRPASIPAGVRKSSRKPMSRPTIRFQQDNSAFAERSKGNKPVRAIPGPGAKIQRGRVERPKLKRPSFPHGVEPKVVLRAFMDYEKQIMAERVKPLQNSRSADRTKPRPGTPQGPRGRSTTRSRQQNKRRP